MTTRAPAFANASAVAKPIPLFPPVTSATFPVNTCAIADSLIRCRVLQKERKDLAHNLLPHASKTVLNSLLRSHRGEHVMLHLFDLADVGLYGLKKWSELWSTSKAHEMSVHRIPLDAQDITVLLLDAAG